MLLFSCDRCSMLTGHVYLYYVLLIGQVIFFQAGRLTHVSGNPVSFYPWRRITAKQWQLQFSAISAYKNIMKAKVLVNTENLVYRFKRYLKSQNFSCTVMVILNLAEVYYLPIPCDATLVEGGTLFCMMRSDSYYKKPSASESLVNASDPSIGSLYRYLQSDHLKISSIFICDDKTIISTYFLCDGFSDCHQNEDENYCHHFSNLPSPSKLCREILLINSSSFDSMCPRQNSSTSETCVHPYNSMPTLTLDLRTIGREIQNAKIKYNKICIYEPNPCSSTDGNGAHLLSCTKHMCNETYICFQIILQFSRLYLKIT